MANDGSTVKPLVAADGFMSPALSKVRQRTVRIEPVVPLTEQLVSQIVDAALLWHHARDMHLAGQMGRSEYVMHEDTLLALTETREVTEDKP